MSHQRVTDKTSYTSASRLCSPTIPFWIFRISSQETKVSGGPQGQDAFCWLLRLSAMVTIAHVRPDADLVNSACTLSTIEKVVR